MEDDEEDSPEKSVELALDTSRTYYYFENLHCLGQYPLFYRHEGLRNTYICDYVANAYNQQHCLLLFKNQLLAPYSQLPEEEQEDYVWDILRRGFICLSQVLDDYGKRFEWQRQLSTSPEQSDACDSDNNTKDTSMSFQQTLRRP